MSLATQSRSHWMTQRRCVGCGLRAETGQAGKALPGVCPRCGIDWSTRPPQSYAELEGFEIEVRPAVVEPDVPGGRERPNRRTKALRALEIGLFLLLVTTALLVASANIVGALRGEG
jgi:hypothetical protein